MSEGKEDSYWDDLPEPRKGVLDVLLASIRQLDYFWVEAHNSYHDPQAFTAVVDAAIQQARNITFRLQAHKDAIPGFDEWYAPWVEYLKAHPILEWTKTARNIIVKERGLSPESEALYLVT
ncbi:MAG: hypothetical protein JXA57_17630 [Armatimonadetes bacterium]|nr:hypothetical protein [Armatimonadota bacterium]